MKVLLVVCLAFAGVSCEADADPYTIGQVLAGIPAAKTALDGQTRILTHVSYPNGVRGPVPVPAVAANVYSTAAAAVPAVTYTHAAAVPAVTYTRAAAVPAVTYTHGAAAVLPAGAATYANHVTGIQGVAGHYLGKREAEAEAEPWTIAQVAAGIPLAKAAAEGRAPGHIAYTEYPTYNAGGVRVAGAPYVAGYAAPSHVATYTTASVAGYPYGAYTGYPFTTAAHYLGKREAEAEADAEAEPWTIGQVAAGLPLLNAAAEGRAPGYIAYTSYPGHGVYSGAPAVYRAAHVPSVYSASYVRPYGVYGAIYG